MRATLSPPSAIDAVDHFSLNRCRPEEITLKEDLGNQFMDLVDFGKFSCSLVRFLVLFIAKHLHVFAWFLWLFPRTSGSLATLKRESEWLFVSLCVPMMTLWLIQAVTLPSPQHTWDTGTPVILIWFKGLQHFPMFPFRWWVPHWPECTAWHELAEPEVLRWFWRWG